jgi:hypothetical protein
MLTTALRIPRAALKALLYAPLVQGGFGVPVIARRPELRLVRFLLGCLNARSVLIGCSFRTFLGEPSTGVAGHEMPALLGLLEEAGLLHILSPYNCWDAAARDNVLLDCTPLAQ